MAFHVRVYKKRGDIKKRGWKKKGGGWCTFLHYVQLNETTVLTVDYLTSNNVVNIFRKDLEKKILFVTSETHFYFNEDIYESVDCGDGFSIGSSSCQFLMVHHEEYWLIQEKALSVLFNKRYVDDIFCIFETEDADKFLDFFNNMHENIRFGQNISRWFIQS